MLSAFFKLLVLWLLKHAVLINFVLAYLLVVKVPFTSCSMPGMSTMLLKNGDFCSLMLAMH